MDNVTSVNPISETAYYSEGKSQRHQYASVSIFQENQEVLYLNISNG